MRQYTSQAIMFNAKNANGATTALNVEAFRHVLLELAQVGFSGTIKFVGSTSDAAPDFSSAASATNPYDYIQVIDYNDNSSVTGSTGITSVTVTSVRNLEANINGLKWFGAILSNVTAGTVNLKGKGFNDA